MNASVTMEELELESAELLPSRETLCCGGCYHSGGTSVFQYGNGNTAQSGWGNISVLNGNLDNNNVFIGL